MDVLWLFFPIIFLVLIIIYSYRYGITPTPTSRKVKRHLLAMLPAIDQGEIAELGSGWGTLVFALARHFPTCKIRGYEISPLPYLISKAYLFYYAYPRVSIERQDFFHISLAPMSLVVCYLYPGAMQRLKAKFERELSPNAYVVSHTFAVPGWVPIRFERAPDLYRTPIYLYHMQNVLAKGVKKGCQQADAQDFA